MSPQAWSGDRRPARGARRRPPAGGPPPRHRRRALYLGRRRNAYIPGLSLEESERKLDALWAHATKPELTWYQEWRVGDVVMWDNYSTMHRRDAFDPSTRRLLRRTQVSGLRYAAA